MKSNVQFLCKCPWQAHLWVAVCCSDLWDCFLFIPNQTAILYLPAHGAQTMRLPTYTTVTDIISLAYSQPIRLADVSSLVHQGCGGELEACIPFIHSLNHPLTWLFVIKHLLSSYHVPKYGLDTAIQWLQSSLSLGLIGNSNWLWWANTG